MMQKGVGAETCFLCRRLIQFYRTKQRLTWLDHNLRVFIAARHGRTRSRIGTRLERACSSGASFLIATHTQRLLTRFIPVLTCKSSRGRNETSKDQSSRASSSSDLAGKQQMVPLVNGSIVRYH